LYLIWSYESWLNLAKYTSVFPSGIVLCRLSGDHPYEGAETNGIHPYKDLAKFGYDPYMKYKSLIHILCL
jgi:hypothetical protein